MDLNMPDSTGVDAIREISKIDPKARFVIVSAVDRRLVWDQCASLGVCEYVSKPVEWPDLKKAIDNLMQSPSKSAAQAKPSKKR
jgi:DNA-binding NarL/FixJ family response regulator